MLGNKGTVSINLPFPQESFLVIKVNLELLKSDNFSSAIPHSHVADTSKSIQDLFWCFCGICEQTLENRRDKLAGKCSNGKFGTF
ncbi:hypothetical protein CEXT_689681 [Caerostris extrusa]|uniref:Uncharacterized protein n=1 Tax=Caerostris extrusa TaxID=172846 RepID=A0AAV4X5P1_CAEEX|nr:hypothetical protein CEXT_689681 [Caerostris extrusa]